ncbi:hypothetical protein FB639_003848, partial [Coemansia asiatica]
TGEPSDVAKQMDTVRARYVEEVILPSLKTEYRVLLCFTFALLSMVARNEETNRMTAYNLAIVWAPNLARSANPMLDVSMCAVGPGAATVGSVVQIMAQMFDKVFSHEIDAILGADADSSVDKARAVLDIVDRMNSGQIDGIQLAPPKLPPRKKQVTPVEKDTESKDIESKDEDEDEDEDEVQIFTDAESESPSSLAVGPVAVTKTHDDDGEDEGKKQSDSEDVAAKSIETSAEPMQVDQESQGQSQGQSNKESS